MTHVPVSISKVIQSKTYTGFILSSHEKELIIYTEPHVGKHIQLHLSGQTANKPRTYDLVNSILSTLHVEILQVVICDVQDSIYTAKIFLKQQNEKEEHYIEITARPSDCISLAIENGAPIYCHQSVLDVAGIEKQHPPLQ